MIPHFFIRPDTGGKFTRKSLFLSIFCACYIYTSRFADSYERFYPDAPLPTPQLRVLSSLSTSVANHLPLDLCFPLLLVVLNCLTLCHHPSPAHDLFKSMIPSASYLPFVPRDTAFWAAIYHWVHFTYGTEAILLFRSQLSVPLSPNNEVLSSSCWAHP